MRYKEDRARSELRQTRKKQTKDIKQVFGQTTEREINRKYMDISLQQQGGDQHSYSLTGPKHSRRKSIGQSAEPSVRRAATHTAEEIENIISTLIQNSDEVRGDRELLRSLRLRLIELIKEDHKQYLARSHRRELKEQGNQSIIEDPSLQVAPVLQTPPDFYSWLKVPSNFPQLKLLVRKKLIEIISDVTASNRGRGL